jgi:hypothetical protein
MYISHYAYRIEISLYKTYTRRRRDQLILTSVTARCISTGIKPTEVTLGSIISQRLYRRCNCYPKLQMTHNIMSSARGSMISQQHLIELIIQVEDSSPWSWVQLPAPVMPTLIQCSHLTFTIYEKPNYPENPTGALNMIYVEAQRKYASQTLAITHFLAGFWAGFITAASRCLQINSSKLLPTSTAVWHSSSVRLVPRDNEQIRAEDFRYPPKSCTSSITIWVMTHDT